MKTTLISAGYLRVMSASRRVRQAPVSLKRDVM